MRYGSYYNRPTAGYSNSHSNAPRKPRTPRVVPVIVEYDSVDVFAAAVAAQRINRGKYLKEPVTELPSVMRDKLRDALSDQDIDHVDTLLTDIVETQSYLPNKVVIRNILNGDRNELTDADREEGALIQSYWRMKMFDTLSGRYVSNFMQASIDAASHDVVKSNDYQLIGIIASMPDSYARYMKKDELNEIKMDAQLVSVHVGTIGTIFTGEVKVLDCRYSQKWGCFYVNAIQDNNLFMWSSRAEIAAESIITISGRIKGHRENNVTHLNYVKIRS